MSSTNRPEGSAPSIRQRIQRRLVPLILLAGVVTAALLLLITIDEVDEAILNNQNNLNHAAAQMYGTELDLSGLPALEAIEELRNPEFLLMIQGADGGMVHQSHPQLPLPVAAQDGPFEWQGWRLFQTHTRDGRVIISGVKQEERDEMILEMVLSAVLPMLVVLGTLLLSALWFVQAGLRPLQHLSEALRNRAPQALTPLESAGQPADLVPIVRALNGLFARVRQFVQRERKFIDDAAHELRTPLTIIKAQVQAIDPAELSPENRTRLDHVVAGVNRAEALGTGLLQQARAEQPSGQGQAVDARAVVQQVLNDLEVLHGAPMTQAVLSTQDAPPIWATPEDLRVILRNLLDNAARHGGPAGTPAQLRIEITTEGTQTLIAIEDDGPGIPQDHRAQVFERFWRAGQTEGSGLGLSIAHTLARRNGLTLNVTEGVHLGGARFELRGRTAAE
ncbi:ATP-binding protein [Thalassobius sp. S69A]|uniref:ATP-binding protein n=1 Tax=unclassified Thalassovita TaxID=2619711 RepID=UPI000C0F3BE7|nr:hypothetical protein [Paracoccaceae bacterium]MBT26015.1 hypothetical protein [Paracoccaceae bacterium]